VSTRGCRVSPQHERHCCLGGRHAEQLPHLDAEELISNVGKIIEPLADLVCRACESDDVDVIYVNDNYGDFTAQFSDLVRSACEGARPGLVEPIVPSKDCRVVTKVRHNAFYSTPVAYCSIVSAPSGGS
jgi:hypothetical protein